MTPEESGEIASGWLITLKVPPSRVALLVRAHQTHFISYQHTTAMCQTECDALPLKWKQGLLQVGWQLLL